MPPGARHGYRERCTGCTLATICPCRCPRPRPCTRRQQASKQRCKCRLCYANRRPLQRTLLDLTRDEQPPPPPSAACALLSPSPPAGQAARRGSGWYFPHRTRSSPPIAAMPGRERVGSIRERAMHRFFPPPASLPGAMHVNSTDCHLESSAIHRRSPSPGAASVLLCATRVAPCARAWQCHRDSRPKGTQGRSRTCVHTRRQTGRRARPSA